MSASELWQVDRQVSCSSKSVSKGSNDPKEPTLATRYRPAAEAYTYFTSSLWQSLDNLGLYMAE
jgi:hypothetical protein